MARLALRPSFRGKGQAWRHLIKSLTLAVLTLALLTPAFAVNSNSIGDVVKAQIIINPVLQVVEKYRKFTDGLTTLTPFANNSSKYFLCYKADGGSLQDVRQVG